jgi:hypothetical protein
MSLKEEKELAVKEMDDIDDIDVILAIRHILNYAIRNKNLHEVKPFTKEELIARTNKSHEQLREGKFYTLEEAKKRLNIS